MIKKVFPILALAMFSSILGLGIIVPLLPLYAQSMGATGVWLGIIMAAYSTTSIASTPVFGRLSDRIGRKRFLCTGLLCYSVISLGYIWAGDVSSLILVRLLQGAAGGMTIPIALAYIGDASPRGEEGKWMGYAHAAFFSGFGIGPLMGGMLTEHFGMTVTFSSMGGLNLIAFFIAAIFLPVVKSRQLRTETHPQPSFREMGKSSMVKGLFCFRLTQAMGRGSFMTFLPILAATYLGLSLTLIGALLAVHVILMSMLGTIGGRIADRFNRRVLIIIGNIIFIAYLALIPLTRNFWQLLGPCLLGGLGGAISVPAASALIVEEGKKFGMGSAMAIFTMAMSLGMIIGPIISGGIAESLGTISVFYFASAVGVVGGALFAWFTR